MGLDYTEGCVNFRDVGGYINLIEGEDVLPEKKIYRGGSIDYVKSLYEIEKVNTIINLRNGQDYQEFDLDYFHFPMANNIEKYNTNLKEVKIWLNSILKIFEDEQLKYPVLIHCLSGKDRTGIVVAALLKILGVKEISIEEEYLLSQGKVEKMLIRNSIEGMQQVEKYFDRIDLEKIKANILR